MANNSMKVEGGSDRKPGETSANEMAQNDRLPAGTAKSDSGVMGRKGFPLALRWFLLWCILLAALTGLRSHTFIAPIDHDEAIFIYGGQAWAAGQTPYRDFWDHKPPHIFLFHSLPLTLFPFSRVAVLMNELLWLALAATLFVAVCRLHLSRMAALVGVVFLCLFVSERVTVRSGGFTEEASLPFVALCYLMIFRLSRRVWHDIFWAGLFLGIAAQFRQTYALSLPFLAAAAWWRSRQASMNATSAMGAMLLGGLGFALPEAYWSGYFAFKGLWREYFEGSYLFNFFYVGAEREAQITLAESIHEHWRVLRDTGPMLAAPILALVLSWWLPRRLRAVLGLLILAFVCEFVPVSISGEYYHHYYIQAAISSCLLLAMVAEAIREIVSCLTGRSLENQSSAAKRVGGAVAALIVLVATAWLTVGGIQTYVERYRSVVRRNQSPTGDLAVEKSLGEVLAQLTEPDERILLLGVQPNACYFAAKRYAGARYFHNAPFFKGKFQKRISQEMQQRMIADLNARRPTIILLGQLEGGERQWLGMDLVDQRAKFLRPYLDENYVPFEQVVSEVPRDWFWYETHCSFLVRKDQVEAVRKRLETILKDKGKSEKVKGKG